MSDKPRDWWINIFSNIVFKEVPDLVLQMDAEIIHVIDHSAYTEQVKRAEDAVTQLACVLVHHGKLETKVAALETELEQMKR